jgi:hypothetical protein
MYFYAERAISITGKAMVEATGTGASGRNDRSQPADSQDFGMENSLQPQSRQVMISGDGLSGGWLRVRGPLRYRRISAGTVARASESHFGQHTLHLGPGESKQRTSGDFPQANPNIDRSQLIYWNNHSEGTQRSSREHFCVAASICELQRWRNRHNLARRQWEWP